MHIDDIHMWGLRLTVPSGPTLQDIEEMDALDTVDKTQLILYFGGAVMQLNRRVAMHGSQNKMN